MLLPGTKINMRRKVNQYIGRICGCACLKGKEQDKRKEERKKKMMMSDGRKKKGQGKERLVSD